jgi:histidyl-tRNA synthetase
MKAQMREANRQEARYVAILGEEELGQGVVQLKNFDSGEQEAVAFEAVVTKINKAVSS